MNPVTQIDAPYLAHDLLDDLMQTTSPKGTKAMLLYEDLARERRREAEQFARDQRLVRHLKATKRWQRLSVWAARRAQRAADQL